MSSLERGFVRTATSSLALDVSRDPRPLLGGDERVSWPASTVPAGGNAHRIAVWCGSQIRGEVCAGAPGEVLVLVSSHRVHCAGNWLYAEDAERMGQARPSLTTRAPRSAGPVTKVRQPRLLTSFDWLFRTDPPLTAPSWASADSLETTSGRRHRTHSPGRKRALVKVRLGALAYCHVLAPTGTTA